jgi:hypothetical protein
MRHAFVLTFALTAASLGTPAGPLTAPDRGEGD